MKKILGLALLSLSFGNSFAQELFPCYDEKLLKYGFCDTNDKLVLKHAYDEAYSFTERGKAVVRVGKEMYLIDTKGTKISSSYQRMYEIAELQGSFFVQQNGKWGIINEAGKVQMPIEYDIKGDLYAALHLDGPSYYGISEPILLYKNGKAGAITLENKVLVPFEYDFVYAILDQNTRSAAAFVLGKEGKYWVTDTKLKQTSDKIYTKMNGSFSQTLNDVPYENNILVFELNGKPLIYNAMSKEYLPDLASFAFEDQMLFVINSDFKMGAVDKSGKVIFPFLYNRINGLDIFQNANGNYSYFAVDIDDTKGGIADKSGKLVSSEAFDPFTITETYIPGYIFAARNGKSLLLKFTAPNKLEVIGRKEGYMTIYTNDELNGIIFEENGKRFSLGFDGKETPIK